jgi:hypothetical protein
MDPRSVAAPNDLSKQLDLALKISAQLRRVNETIARAPATEHVTQGLRTAQRSLLLALNMVESADRTPPQRAYVMFEQASKDLDFLIGRSK